MDLRSLSRQIQSVVREGVLDVLVFKVGSSWHYHYMTYEDNFKEGWWYEHPLYKEVFELDNKVIILNGYEANIGNYTIKEISNYIKYVYDSQNTVSIDESMFNNYDVDIYETPEVGGKNVAAKVNDVFIDRFSSDFLDVEVEELTLSVPQPNDYLKIDCNTINETLVDLEKANMKFNNICDNYKVFKNLKLNPYEKLQLLNNDDVLLYIIHNDFDWVELSRILFKGVNFEGLKQLSYYHGNFLYGSYEDSNETILYEVKDGYFQVL